MQKLRLIVSFTTLSGVLLLTGCNLPLPAAPPSTDTLETAAASLTATPLPVHPSSTQVPGNSPTMTSLPTRVSTMQPPDNVWVIPCRENITKNCSQMEFDTVKWEVVPQAYSWSPKLVHRTIAGCEIVPSGGRGLKDDGWSVEHDLKTLGTVQYELFRVSEGDELRFIGYWLLIPEEGSMAYSEVRFENDQDGCIQDAEAVLTTQRMLTLRPKG